MIEGDFEAAVAAQLAGGHVTAAATVVLEKLGPAILGYLRSVVRDLDDADDAFGRWAESVWSGLPGFRGEAPLESWCYRVAWHAALRVLRDPYLRRRAPLDTSDAGKIAERVRTSTASFLGTTAQDRLAELRRSLSPEEQTLLTLRLDRALSWREIAHVMAEEGVDVSEASLRKRYERLKDRVREMASAAGLLGPA